jgi:hypothetical protein
MPKGTRGAAQCKAAGCGERAHGHGYCRKHYARWKRHGDPEMVLPKGHFRTTFDCTVGGCERLPVAKGYCGLHYERWKRHGDPLKVIERERRICEIQGCERPNAIKGLCEAHAGRLARNGDTEADVPIRPHSSPALERFGAKVNREGPIPAHRLELGPCAEWTGALQSAGYGSFGAGEGSAGPVLAHKWAWEQEHGPVPDGFELDHLCHNGSGCAGGPECVHRRCVNLAHLEPVPHRVNSQRGETGKHWGSRKA